MRSLVVYWRPGRQRGLRRLYAPFVSSGDVVFDVGAHLGDRTAAFAALGARVVALEPQPRVARWLERLVGGREGVTVVRAAAGAEAGRATLAVSGANPTVSTLASGWRHAIGGANPTFADVRWEERVEVPVTTLDELIDRHGSPSFVKIDVEGFEARVLAGLSHPLPALSVEFVRGSLEVAVACVHRLQELGRYRYNAIAGEGRSFRLAEWCDAATIIEWLGNGADGISSGDLYARREAP
jgi:FkbM family methyltransferase